MGDLLMQPVAHDPRTRSWHDDDVQHSFLSSFTDFQRRAARVDGALGRQRSLKKWRPSRCVEGLRGESWIVDIRERTWNSQTRRRPSRPMEPRTCIVELVRTSLHSPNFDFRFYLRVNYSCIRNLKITNGTIRRHAWFWRECADATTTLTTNGTENMHDTMFVNN